VKHLSRRHLLTAAILAAALPGTAAQAEEPMGNRPEAPSQEPPALSVGGADRGEIEKPTVFTSDGPLEMVPSARARTIAGLRSCEGMTVEFVGTGIGEEGDTPTDVVYTDDGSKFLISHLDSQNVIVFDAVTRDILQVIDLSGSPQAIDVSSDGVHAVTANAYEDTASIIDIVAGTEVAVVPIGDQPAQVVISPDGLTAVVGNTLEDSLSVIDIASATESRRIPDMGFWSTYSVTEWAILYTFSSYVILPDNQTLVFPHMDSDSIEFVDLTTGTVNSLIVDDRPMEIRMNSTGTQAVAMHHYQTGGLMTVLDLTAQTVEQVITPPLGVRPANPAISEYSGDDTKVAISTETGGIAVITIATGESSPKIVTGSFLTGGRTTADGLYCVVSDYYGSILDWDTEIVVDQLNPTIDGGRRALSPTTNRGATFSCLGDEFLESFTVSGAGIATLDGPPIPTGPPPEGDKAHSVALSPDAKTAYVLNNHSRNITEIDLTTNTVIRSLPVGDFTGDRPGDVEVTPDGTRVVVSNKDDYFATIINLTTDTVTDVPMGRRCGKVLISPDSQYAYMPVVADGDGVQRINLDTLSLDGPKIPTGNMGGIGFPFGAVSGVVLSHDGSLLVTCGTYDDNISIIDTAAWSKLDTVGVGDYPVRVAFSPDDARIFVVCRNDPSVYVVEHDGTSWEAVDIIFVGLKPWNMVVDSAGTRLYVNNYDGKSTAVIDLTTNTLIEMIGFPSTNGGGEPVDLALNADESKLYVTCNGADFHEIDTATNTIAETVNTGLVPVELVWDDVHQRAIVPSPKGDDGIHIITPCNCPEDLNGDGTIDLSDLGILLASFEVDDGGDIDGDGDTDLSDLGALLARFGQDC
jgi:YVTN family beta-propeller protein